MAEGKRPKPTTQPTLLTHPIAFQRNDEFYNIQLAHLSTGEFDVSLTVVTVYDEQPHLLNQETVVARVAAVDDVLSLIRAAVDGVFDGS